MAFHPSYPSTLSPSSHSVLSPSLGDSPVAPLFEAMGNLGCPLSTPEALWPPAVPAHCTLPSTTHHDLCLADKQQDTKISSDLMPVPLPTSGQLALPSCSVAVERGDKMAHPVSTSAGAVLGDCSCLSQLLQEPDTFPASECLLSLLWELTMMTKTFAFTVDSL